MKAIDLELCKKIADIDGVAVHVLKLSYGEKLLRGDGTRDRMPDYNPLTDKAMLLDLIFDHGVSICRDRDCVYIESDWRDRAHKSLVSFSGKEDFSRAALECIVEANNA